MGECNVHYYIKPLILKLGYLRNFNFIIKKIGGDGVRIALRGKSCGAENNEILKMNFINISRKL